MTTAAIFDLDGTLADTMPTHFRAWQEVAEKYGIDFPENRFYALGGIPTKKIAQILIEEQGLSANPEEVAKDREEAYERRLDEIGRLEAIIEIADELRKKGPIAIASGGQRKLADRVLDKLGIKDWFKVVLTSEDTKNHKPDPEPFLEAAKRMGVDPKDCTVYEDSDPGLEAARRAGMKGVDVRALAFPSR